MSLAGSSDGCSYRGGSRLQLPYYLLARIAWLDILSISLSLSLSHGSSSCIHRHGISIGEFETGKKGRGERTGKSFYLFCGCACMRECGRKRGNIGNGK